MKQAPTIQHLPPEAVHRLLEYVPDYVKAALLKKSADLDCSLEASE